MTFVMDKTVEYNLRRTDDEFNQMFFRIEESTRLVTRLIDRKHEIENNLGNPRFVAMVYRNDTITIDVWHSKLIKVKLLIVRARKRREKRQKHYDVTYRMIKDYEGVALTN